MEKIIKRINELAAIAKERELTDEENAERRVLREEYLKLFRKNFKNHIENIKVVDPEGNDITPQKIKDAKARKNKN